MFKRINSFFFRLLFCAIAVSVFSCNEKLQISPVKYAALRGRVLYNADQQPVQKATVTLSPNNRVVSTDAAGVFQFDSIALGSYLVQAEKSGYVTQVATVSAITTDKLPVITLLLTKEQEPVVPPTPVKTNNPPTIPTLFYPVSNGTVLPGSVTLRWKAADPENNSLTYDVTVFKTVESAPVFSYTGLTADTLTLPNLDYSTTYFWKVVAKDSANKVSSPIWSFRTSAFPNYGYLFVRPVNGQFQIFGANATGEAVQLTRNGSNWRPIVSPDRQQIAFISTQNASLHLFLMNTDGSNIRQVTSSVPVASLYQSDLSFCWSPDGTQLLYPNNNRLFVINTNGTGLRVVLLAPESRVYTGCDWTAQGDLVVTRTVGNTVYDNELTTQRIDGSNYRSVYLRRNKRMGNPAFSVTGRQLIFSADSSGFTNVQGRQLDARLYLLDLTTNGLTDLSVFTGNQSGVNLNNKPAGTNDIDPLFSPNGAQIIFTNADNSDAGTPAVYSINLSSTILDNRSRKQLFSAAEMPFWRQP